LPASTLKGGESPVQHLQLFGAQTLQQKHEVVATPPLHLIERLLTSGEDVDDDDPSVVLPASSFDEPTFFHAGNDSGRARHRSAQVARELADRPGSLGPENQQDLKMGQTDGLAQELSKPLSSGRSAGIRKPIADRLDQL